MTHISMTHVSMTSTAAIRHMSHTLTGAIAQSHQPGFIAAEAYADIKTNYELVAANCTDLATVVWLHKNLCFGYIGDECTFEEINLGYRDRFDFILRSGWRPGTAPENKLVLSNMFELDWYGAEQIVVTGNSRDQVCGTATLTDTDGEYQVAFEWIMDMGEEAEQAGLHAAVNITAARFTLPYEFSLFECDGRPLNTLVAVKEMECGLRFCDDIIRELYDKYAPTEGVILRG